MHFFGFWSINLVLWLFSFAANVTLNKLDGIIRGNEVSEGSAKWPFMASLLSYNRESEMWESFCGGTVINKDSILTAAHCFPDLTPDWISDDTLVYLGNENVLKVGDKRNQFEISKIVVHPDYLHENFQNDIAMIKLKTPIKFDNHPKIKTVCLPATNDVSAINQSNCYVMGWGLNENNVTNDILHDLMVPVLSESTCNKYQVKDIPYIPKKMLCAGYIEGGKDSCQGDSGGPLVCPHSSNHSLYVHIGIVSFGDGCAESKNPGFYTKVTYYLDWIQKTAQD